MVQQPALGIGAFHGMRSRSARSTWDGAILADAFWLKLSPVSWRIKAEKNRSSSPHTKHAQKSQKRVGWYCGTYTGTVPETPLFTVHLYNSETRGQTSNPGRITGSSSPEIKLSKLCVDIVNRRKEHLCDPWRRVQKPVRHSQPPSVW